MQEAIQDDGAFRLSRTRAEIGKASALAARKPSDVNLIAVSKTRTADQIRPLLAAGHRSFGENRVQEAADKWPALRAEFADVSLHLIGQLQSNKAEDAVQYFDFIHALDRVSLAEALGKAMTKIGKFPPCFIQVNIGAEPQKGGCAIADIGALYDAARGAGIHMAGLMCLPPANAEPAPYFALLAELAQHHQLPGLSMGMSDDFASAIMLGATHVRVGTALFGPRGN
jgi:PLP dependent protein